MMQVPVYPIFHSSTEPFDSLTIMSDSGSFMREGGNQGVYSVRPWEIIRIVMLRSDTRVLAEDLCISHHGIVFALGSHITKWGHVVHWP